MPRIQVAAEHHDFLCLVGAGNLGHDVVGRAPLWVGAIDDIELELHVGAVCDESRDAPVVFISHDERWYRFGHVERAVVERANLAVIACRVVETRDRAGATRN